jgi:hypothetical protein
VTLNDKAALALDDVSAASLTVTAGGALTQTAAKKIVVTGLSTLSVGAVNDITLDNAANDFSTVVVTSGKDVKLTDANDLALVNMTASGDVKMVVGGDLDLQGDISAIGNAVDLQFNTITVGGTIYGKTLELNSPNNIGSVGGDKLALNVTESVNVSGAGKVANFTGAGASPIPDDKYSYSVPWNWQLFYNDIPLNASVKGAQQQSAFDLVKFNPTLLSAQSVFGQPLFLHDNLDVSEPVALGLVDYLLAGAAVVGADPEFPPEANAEISSGAAGSRTSIGFYKPGGWWRLFHRSPFVATTDSAVQ